MDSAYDVFNASTPRGPGLLPFPSMAPTAPNTPANHQDHTDSYFTTRTTSTSNTETPRPPPLPSKEPDDPAKLLAALRHNFHKVEQSLYAQLARTPDSTLNDVRRTFIATGLGSRNRIKAWQKKHLGTAKSSLIGDLKADEPSWWGRGCHAVPGCNIVVRETDWGSIIAHTLRCVPLFRCFGMHFVDDEDQYS